MSGGAGARQAVLRRMRPDETGVLRSFLAEHVPADRPQLRPGCLEWQYRDNPDGCDVRFCHVGDRLAGVSGFIPCAVEVDGIRRRGAFSTNTLVDPAFRRRGIGRTIHEARLADYDWALSSGQSPENARLYRRLGFLVVGRYRRCLAQTHLPRPGLRRRFAREAASWLRWRAAAGGCHAGLDVRVDDAVPDVPAACYTGRFAAGALGPVRTPGHVAWRYLGHPYFQYRFAVVARASAALGFAVLRPDAGRFLLVDLYAPYAEQAGVLHAVAAALGPVGGQFTGAALDRVFRAAGWMTWPGSNRLLGKSDDAALHRLLERRSWCFFGGDSDADR